MKNGKIIIIDGTVGSAKTTCILGVSTSARLGYKYPCIAAEGYPVAGEAIRAALANLRLRGIDPFSDFDVLFDLILEISVDMYQKASERDITFFERGIPYLKLLADYFGYTIGNKYYEYCEIYKYSSPIFVFAPIISFDLTSPVPGDEPRKIYTLEQRLSEHDKVMRIYKTLGYNVIEVPVFTEEDIAENSIKRISMIKECLKL